MDPRGRLPATLNRSKSPSRHSHISIDSTFRMKPSGLLPKSASDWDDADLITLDVEMVKLSVSEFFGCPPAELPTPQFIYDSLYEILTARIPPMDENAPLARDITIRNFFESIDCVSRSNAEVNVDMLAYKVLEQMGFQILTNPDNGQQDDYPRPISFIAQQREPSFPMSNQTAIAKVDLALMDATKKTLCLFVENKRLVCSRTDNATITWAHPQVVAEALVAATTNLVDCQAKRFHDVIIPAFSFSGSLPCFYLIPITAAFITAVGRGEVPPHPTKVFFCVAPVEHEFYGMMLKSQCLLILSMFEAFKRFIPSNLAELCRFSGAQGVTIPRSLSPSFTNVWDCIHRFLWECEEHFRELGVDKADYFGNVNLIGKPTLPIHLEGLVTSISPPPPIPEGYWNVQFPTSLKF